MLLNLSIKLSVMYTPTKLYSLFTALISPYQYQSLNEGFTRKIGDNALILHWPLWFSFSIGHLEHYTVIQRVSESNLSVLCFAVGHFHRTLCHEGPFFSLRIFQKWIATANVRLSMKLILWIGICIRWRYNFNVNELYLKY